MVHKKTSLAVDSADEDTCREHVLVHLIDLSDDRLLLLEEENKFEEANSIMPNDLVCLALLRSNLLLLWLCVTKIRILHPLERL